MIQNVLEGFHGSMKPATKEHIDKHPINGMFIPIPRKVRNKTEDISPKSDRIQAILLDTNDDVLMIIDVYFPGDTATAKHGSDAKLEDMLVAILK